VKKNMLAALILVEMVLFECPIASQEQICQEALSQISADSIKKHLVYLASDELAGRGTGTPGGEKAARYLSNQFRKYNLKPVGDNRTYFQKIPMHGSLSLNESKLQLLTPTRAEDFVLKRDYLLYKTGAQTFIPQPVPLVFVGYGIIAPEFDYNDYQYQNVAGKIVVFLSGEPPSSDPAYFNGADPTVYSYPEAKQRIAISRGAKGSILIPTPRAERGRTWRYWVDTFEFEDVTLAYSVISNLSLIMNPNAAEKLFIGADYTLRQLFEMEKTNLIRSFRLNTKLSFKGKFNEREFFASNVVGLLAGAQRKPNDRYLLISAHYDHLGVGRPVAGDSIYNGVQDNAIGVAGLLEIARVFSIQSQQPKRSVLFLLTTGEEKGLLGSTYYVDHPIFPLYKTIANINIDGLALFDTFNDIIGVGAELSTLETLLKKVSAELNLTVSPIPSPFLDDESFARSDQISFAKAGIPSILIAEGLDFRHYSTEAALKQMLDWAEKVYHTPFDDLDQPMNLVAAQQHCQVIFSFCCQLANSSFTPEWVAGTPFVNARLQSIAEKK